MSNLIRSFVFGLLIVMASPLAVYAQCSGQAPASTYCGNPTGALALPGWKPFSAIPFPNISGGTVVGNRGTSTAAASALTNPILGIPGTSTGEIGLAGITSGVGTIRAQSAAGSAVLLVPTVSGTLVGSASSPLSIASTTGTISCPTCLTTSGGFANPTASVGLSAVNGVATTAMRSDSAPPLSQAIVPTWTGIHTWSADGYFASGRPWCDVRAKGAVGDQLTDDTAAFTACKTQLASIGGTIYVPPGNYCLFSGFTLDGSVPVQLIGSGWNTEIQTCGHDVTALTVNSSQNRVADLVIAGPQIVTTTHDGLAVGPSCADCRFDRLYLVGGRYALYNTAADIRVSYIKATQAYGGAIIYNGTASGNAQMYCADCKLDQEFPISTPSAPVTFAARANLTLYSSVGTVVSSGGYYIQLKTAGTSGSGSPTIQPYGVDITDGTAVWRLVGKTTYAAMQIDSNSSSVTLLRLDMTGSFTYGLYISNTLGGTAPQSTTLTDSFIGEAYVAGINFAAGADLKVKGNQIKSCLGSNCQGITLGSSAGDTSIVDNMIFSNPYGIVINTGTNHSIVANNIANASGAAIFVQANASQFTVVGNTVGGSSTWGTNTIGVQIAAGTSNNYIVAENICLGATTCISDGGTGTAKTVGPQKGYFGIAAAPSSPPSGFVASWFDSTDLRMHDKNSAGTIGTSVVADTGATNNFLTAISAAGVISKARPTCANLSDSASGCTTTIGSGTAGAIPYYTAANTLAASSALTSNELVLGGGTGTPTTLAGCTGTSSSVQCVSSSAGFPQNQVKNNANDAVSGKFIFQKTRNSTDTLTNDQLFDMQISGYANSNTRTSARQEFYQQGTSSGNNIPTYVKFSTSNAAGQLNHAIRLLDQGAHMSITAQATAPTLTAGCNGAGSSIADGGGGSGKDMHGTVTGQTAAATTCTVTFGTTYTNTPDCVAMGLSSPLTGAVTVSTSTLVVNFASTANYKFTYHCFGT